MPRPVRRRRVADVRALEERREELLAAAVRVIDRDGHAALSVEAIAKEAGVSRPVVYRAFDGFGALLLALMDRQQQRSMNQLYAALDLDAADRGDLVGTIERAGPALHQMLVDDPATWRVILDPGPDVPDAVRDRVAGDREQLRSVFEQFLCTRVAEAEAEAETEAAKGEIEEGAPGGGARSIDCEILSHALVAALEQLGRLVLSDPERYDAKRLTGTARLLLGG